MAASQASLAYTVAVGSKNKAKIAAVQSAIQSVFPDATLTIKGYGAASGVPDQRWYPRLPPTAPSIPRNPL